MPEHILPSQRAGTGRWRMPPLVAASLGLHAAAAAALAWPGAWPWALAGVALDQAALAAAGLWPRSALLGPNVTHLPAAAQARRQVAITIDDGPDPQVTPAVLDLLAAHGAQATFFCIAQQVRSQPALARRIVAAGHSVQNHSLHHSHAFALMGPRTMAREVGDANAVLADVTGVRPHCFRAPAGLRNPWLDLVLHRLGLHLVSWSARGFDTREGDAGRVMGRLTRRLCPGAIVLMHDGNACRTPGGAPVLLEVLPRLLAHCRDHALHATTLAQALPPRPWAT